jgi:hypothetical protein
LVALPPECLLVELVAEVEVRVVLLEHKLKLVVIQEA